MTADLTVPFTHGRSIQIVRTFQHGILAELFLDVQHRFLQGFLPFQLAGVSEQIHLQDTLILDYTVCRYCYSPQSQISVGDAVEQFRGSSHQLAAEIGRVVQSCTAVSTLRDSAAVVIDMDRTVIDALVAVLSVVTDVQCQAVRDQSLVRELEYQTVGHLLDDDPSLIIRIRTGKYLSFGQAVGFRAILYALGYLYEHRDEADHKQLMLTLRSILFAVREGVF